MVNYDNGVFSMFLLKLTNKVYIYSISKGCLIVHFLAEMNDSYDVTVQGSRFSYYTRNPQIIIITECYRGSNGSKKPEFSYIHSHLWIKKEKYQDLLRLVCFSECFGFEAILLCLWFTCVCCG